MSITTSRNRLLSLLRDFSEMKLFELVPSPLDASVPIPSKSRPHPISDVIIGSKTVDNTKPNFANLPKCFIISS